MFMVLLKFKIKMKNIFYIIFFVNLFASFVSCDVNKNNINENDSYNDVKLKIDFDSIISARKEACAYIYFENNDYKLIRAYIECDAKPEEIDLVNYEISVCHKKLYIENDTAFLCIEPNIKGKIDFENIKIIYKMNSQYHVLDTMLTFNVH